MIFRGLNFSRNADIGPKAKIELAICGWAIVSETLENEDPSCLGKAVTVKDQPPAEGRRHHPTGGRGI